MAQNDEISIYEITAVFKKRWQLILLPAVIAAVLAGVIASSMPKKYESFALIRIGYAGDKRFEDFSSAKAVMESSPVQKLIAQELGGRTAAEVGRSLRYEDLAGSIKITACSRNPQSASEIARAATKVFMARQDTLLKESQSRFDKLLAYLREHARPNSLTLNMRDISIEPAAVEIAPFINPVPVPAKRGFIVAAVFLMVLFVNTLAAFYIEGKENK